MKRTIVTMLIISICLAICCPVVYADTDGTEPRVLDEPNKLVVQLGPEWAGVAFELKTDAGTYPQPLVVDDTGILSMEIGGSNTYILSCVGSKITASPPNTQVNQKSNVTNSKEQGPAATISESKPVETEGIPVLHLILFFGGLAVCIAGLIIMRIMKIRRQRHYEDDEWDV